jgi:uncharacterized membrane protein YcaP (DUF421 family)
MLQIDWEQLFVPSGSLMEIAVRGTSVYLFLFAVIRFLPRRAVGGMGPADILVIVLIADAVQIAMAGGYQSITEGILLAAVIFAWATFIDWLDFKFPHWHIAGGKELPLIRDGRILHRNLKREQITEDELMAQLRQHGLDDVSQVRLAYVEGDGHFSVLLRSRQAMQPPPQKKTPG